MYNGIILTVYICMYVGTVCISVCVLQYICTVCMYIPGERWSTDFSSNISSSAEINIFNICIHIIVVFDIVGQIIVFVCV